MTKITERYKTRISKLKKEIKEQDKAIDKAIKTNNTLHSFLEYPHQTANNATYYYHSLYQRF